MRELRARRWSRLRIACPRRWRLLLAACSLLAAGCASGGFSASISDDELPLEDASPYPTAVAKPALGTPSPDPFSRSESEPEPTILPQSNDQEPKQVPVTPAPLPIQQPATPLAVVPAALRSLPQPSSDVPAQATQSPPATSQAAEASLPPIVSANDLPARQPVAPPPEAPVSPPVETASSGVPSEPIAPTAAVSGPAAAGLLPEERLAAIAQQRDVLIAMLEEDLRARTADPSVTNTPDAEVGRLEQQLRLLYAMAERPDDAVRPIEGLSEAEREAYRQLLFGVSTWLAPEEARRAPLRNARVLRSLRDATRELAAASKLDLRNVTFCERVESFGWFTAFARNEFQPKQQVLLYVEVDNFVAQEKGPHSFETELQGHYQIFDSRENIVAERQLPLDREVCRNYRRDYFLAYPIFLPESIAPGRYRLELTIEDHKAGSDYQGRKFGTAAIEFSIR